MGHRGLLTWNGQQGSHGYRAGRGAALRPGVSFRFLQDLVATTLAAVSRPVGNLGTARVARFLPQRSGRHRWFRAWRAGVGLCSDPVPGHCRVSRPGGLAASLGIRLRRCCGAGLCERLAASIHSSAIAGGDRVRDHSPAATGVCRLLVFRNSRAEFECCSTGDTDHGGTSNVFAVGRGGRPGGCGTLQQGEPECGASGGRGRSLVAWLEDAAAE